MTLEIGVKAAAHDQNVEQKLRHALRAVDGLDPSLHNGIVESCRASGLFPMASYTAAEMRAASAIDQITAASKEMASADNLVQRLQAAAGNEKKKQAVRSTLALLRRLNIEISAAADRKTLNAAIKDLPIDKKFEVKSALAFAGILD